MLYAIGALCLALSFISARNSFYPLKLLTSFAWFGLLTYWITADLLTDGDPADVIVMITIMMAAVLFLLWGVAGRQPASDIEESYSPTGRLLNRTVKTTRSSIPKQSSSKETVSEYRNKVRKALNTGKKRRR